MSLQNQARRICQGGNGVPLQHLAVVGPTGTGKSALAIALAQELSAEIVSLDSQQVYQGMDIGTGKVLPHERGGIPHHLLDLIPPSTSWSLAQFLNTTRPLLAECKAQGRRTILVGGTGLYLDALVDGYILDDAVPDHGLEAAVRMDPHGAWDEVAEANATPRDPQNPRRVARALARVRQGFSGRGGKKDSEIAWKCGIIGISMEPSVLRERIALRVHGMFQAGLLDEVATLLAQYGADAPGLQALGYRECAEVLHGRAPRAGLEDRVILHTRQYAKRQRTWFRHRQDITWVQAE